jgi:enoyl-CoA hydratase
VKSSHVIVEDDGRFRAITLDSLANRNALSPELLTDLHRAIEGARTSSSRIVKLGHTGETFSSGLDLRSVVGQVPDLSPLALVLDALQQTRQPVIVVVNGAVRAGGLGILAACDVVFASPQASFAFTETQIGAVPALISSPILQRTSPREIARYFLSGEIFDALVAEKLGLVSEVSDDPLAAALRWSESVLSAAPRAVEVALSLLRASLRGELPAIDSLRRLSEQTFAGDEAQEGIKAILEKRLPAWRGSSGWDSCS